MKKVKWYSLLLMCLMVAICPLLIPSEGVEAKSNTVSASVPSNYGTTIVQGTDILDGELYDKLQSEATKFLRGTLREFTFWDIESLDLSGSPMTGNKIKDLSGLNKLDFRSLKVLKLNYNDLGSITADPFKFMPKLTTLELVNCNINSIDLTKLTSLRKLVINGNNLTSIKLNNMVVNGSEYLADKQFISINSSSKVITWNDTVETVSYVDLSNNNITSLKNIKFPEDVTSTKCTIDMYNNGLSDYDNSLVYIDLNLGLQGLAKSNLNIDTVDDRDRTYIFKSTPFFYQLVGDANLEFKFVRTYTEQGVNKIQNIVISDDTMQTSQTFMLDLGHYTMDVYYNGDVIDYDTSEWACYQQLTFDVLPSTPTHYYVVKGVRYPELVHLTQITTINLEADSGAEIYYRFSSSNEWVKGNSLTIKQGGNRTVYVKSVIGDYESKEKMITINAAASLRVPSLLIVVLLIFALLVIVFVGVPLLRRYIIRA